MTSGSPAEDSSSRQEAAPGPRRPLDGDSRILVVDDNVPTARALAALLATAHYKSAVFHCGVDALGYARENCCLAAVVDIRLPDISGIEVAERLRGFLGAATPIVVVSGDTSISTLSAVSKAGATHFFSKPVNANHLLERLCQWITDAGDATKA